MTRFQRVVPPSRYAVGFPVKIGSSFLKISSPICQLLRCDPSCDPYGFACGSYVTLMVLASFGALPRGHTMRSGVSVYAHLTDTSLGRYGPSNFHSLPKRCSLNLSACFAPSRKTVRMASSSETNSLSRILNAVTFSNCS